MALALLAGSQLAWGFPTWMGVYGDFVRSDEDNPGTFTVLMNQDYYGLDCDLCVSADGGTSWTAWPMVYAGNTNGNSIWAVTPGIAFTQGDTVTYYFHGHDAWGGNIYDSNGGANYAYTAGPARIHWLGNTSHWPTNGAITPADDLYVNVQTWPRNAVVTGGVVYTSTRGMIWDTAPLLPDGTIGGNDAWYANLGRFGWNKDVQYSVYVTDGQGTAWDNNAKSDYHAVINTDPSLADDGDFDGDGIPNGVEYQIGYDPMDPRDGARDSDGDGIADGEEYGTCQMFAADTDGDGVQDFEEVHGFLTDPAVSNAFSFQAAFSVPLASPSSLVGEWTVTNGTAIGMTGTRGAVSYAVTLADADIYRIDIHGFGAVTSAWLRVSVDGVPLLRDADGSGDAPSEIALHSFFTPFLAAGTHVMRVEWDNTFRWNQFWIERIAWVRIAGEDNDADGIADWVARTLAARNTASLCPATSVSSPAFLEGKAAYPELMSINAGAVPVCHGASGWYADVPLSEPGTVSVALAFENGGLAETHEIAWTALNLLDAADMTFRKGDSLKLTADDFSGANGTASVEIDGVPRYTLAQGETFIHVFTNAGAFSFSTTLAYGTNSVTATQTMTVIEASFPTNSPVCGLGRARYWDCPLVPTNVTIVADPALSIFSTETLPGGGTRFRIGTDRFRARYLEARVGGTTGAILDSTPVEGVAGYGSNYTWLDEISTEPDGSKIIHTGLIMAPLREDVALRVVSLGGGVTYDDGTTDKTFHAEDFDENGTCSLHWILPGTQTAPCHNVKTYQNGVLISE